MNIVIIGGSRGIGKAAARSHRPDLPSVPTVSTGGSEYPTFTGRYLLGSRWTAFFLPKETH